MARYDAKIKHEIEKLYCEQFLSVPQLSRGYHIQPKTLYRWRNDGKWDEPVKEFAKTMYLEEQAKVPAIAEKVKRSIAQIKEWKKEGKWDDDIVLLGDIALSRSLLRQISEDIRKAITDGSISEPGVADRLTKSLAIVKHMMPKRIQLANIFQLLKDLTGFITTLGDDDFAKLFQKYLPEMADYLRGKYAAE